MKNLTLDRQQIIDALKKANTINKSSDKYRYVAKSFTDVELEHLSTVDLLTNLIYVLNQDLFELDNDKALNISNVW